MPVRVLLFAAFFAFLAVPFGGGCGTAQAADGVEALEIGAANRAELPRGKEADGIQGDFVLRNEHLEALVAGNLPHRRANMGTHYRAPTPGCLYDLAVHGSDNDQLTAFCPGQLEGPVSSVAIAAVPATSDPAGAVAEVVVSRTAARGDGKQVEHRYRLHHGARYLEIISTYSCHGENQWQLDPSPYVKGLLATKQFAGIHFADAQNPADHQAYAWAAVEENGEAESTLVDGETRTITTRIAPGRSPAEAFGIIATTRGETGTLHARLHDSGAGIASGALEIQLDEKTTLPAYPDADGAIHITLPSGKYRYKAVDIGRSTHEGDLEISTGALTSLDLDLGPASKVHFDLSDATPGGRDALPCKVQFIGRAGTRSPHLGVDIQAHGCRNQYHSEGGNFTVQVPAGSYRVIVTRGIEYSHLEKEVDVPPGEEVVVRGSLERIVDTRGWISTDFHNHSTPSGDNYCGTPDRMINLAAEHIEFAPATEHNRFFDWAPTIQELGLEQEIATVLGLELTGGGPHLNSFPFEASPWLQDGGAPRWKSDPRINAIVLRDFQGGHSHRYVQLNHPNVGAYFRDRDADGLADGGFVGLERLIDAAEVWSEHILKAEPWLTVTWNGEERTRRNRTFEWLQLLNQGRHMYCVAVSDAHSVFGNGVGGWRTYVPSTTDAPSEIDFRDVVRHAQAGRMVMTNGPFLEARLDDGTLPGESTRIRAPFEAHVRVQCTDWIEIDRVQVLINGRADEAHNYTRARHPKLFADDVIRFDQRLPITLQKDAHLIVVAYGEEHDLETGYGTSWQSGMHPCAFTNPIFVDVDGNGFQPSGDTLGHPLPVGTQQSR